MSGVMGAVAKNPFLLVLVIVGIFALGGFILALLGVLIISGVIVGLLIGLLIPAILVVVAFLVMFGVIPGLKMPWNLGVGVLLLLLSYAIWSGWF
ncbi:MAG: hypothetical protein PHG80_10940 [Methanoregulaceae archaeon]|nr:hypothetical protein [Methanoregulaceae archaeon]